MAAVLYISPSAAADMLDMLIVSPEAGSGLGSGQHLDSCLVLLALCGSALTHTRSFRHGP